MSETKVAGSCAKHSIVTPVCVANRTLEGAIDEALARLREEALGCRAVFESGGQQHFVLTVEWKPEPVDAIISSLYRRFKDWSKRGFGPDDVTWCEVKAEVLALVAIHLAASEARAAEARATIATVEGERDRQYNAGSIARIAELRAELARTKRQLEPFLESSSTDSGRQGEKEGSRG